MKELPTQNFADLLSDALHQIKQYEGKNISLIQDEIGYELDREGGSVIENWRRQGRTPPKLPDLRILAGIIHSRSGGYFNKEWFSRFFESAECELTPQFYNEILNYGSPSRVIMPPIDTPLRVMLIKVGKMAEGVLETLLKFRGIHISQIHETLSDLDGVIIHGSNFDELETSELNHHIRDAITFYQRQVDLGCPIYILGHTMSLAFAQPVLQEIRAKQNQVHYLDSSSLGVIANYIFDSVFDFGYERRDRPDTIDVTVRTMPSQPESTLLDMDWQFHLDRGRYPSESEWLEFFAPALEAVSRKLLLLPDKTLIRVDSRLFLPAAVAVGYYLNVRMVNISVWSRTRGQSGFRHSLWTLKNMSLCEKMQFPVEITPLEEMNGRTAILEISIQRPISADVLAFLGEQNIKPDLYITSRIFDDNSENRNIEEDVAFAYADFLGQLVRRVRSEYGIVDFHLFIQLPHSLGILIGRNLLACGRLHLYWFDDPSYQFAFTLK